MQIAILNILINHTKQAVVRRFAALVPLIFRTKLEKNSVFTTELLTRFLNQGIGPAPKRVNVSKLVIDEG